MRRSAVGRAMLNEIGAFISVLDDTRGQRRFAG
jgi:hypothetical protein